MAEEKGPDQEKDKTAEKQKQIQQKYVEYQVAEQQVKQLQQQLEKLEQQTIEAAAIEQSITDIAKAKPGEEILVPVSGGVFFKASMKDSGRFLVNVGGGIVVEKDVDGTTDLLKQQSEEISKYKDQIAMQISEQMMKHQELEAELKKLIED